ncbi:MAG: hypothetical protein EPN84_00250 [Legionella sp.]|nr:MAG: hypothetical protein EPN84_00250 [Legionella sp.]
MTTLVLKNGVTINPAEGLFKGDLAKAEKALQLFIKLNDVSLVAGNVYGTLTVNGKTSNVPTPVGVVSVTFGQLFRAFGIAEDKLDQFIAASQAQIEALRIQGLVKAGAAVTAARKAATSEEVVVLSDDDVEATLTKAADIQARAAAIEAEIARVAKAAQETALAAAALAATKAQRDAEDKAEIVERTNNIQKLNVVKVQTLVAQFQASIKESVISAEAKEAADRLVDNLRVAVVTLSDTTQGSYEARVEEFKDLVTTYFDEALPAFANDFSFKEKVENFFKNILNALILMVTCGAVPSFFQPAIAKNSALVQQGKADVLEATETSTNSIV